MATKTATLTSAEKKQALGNAIKAHNARIDYAKKIKRNTFSEWGNDKCISRLKDTIAAMRSGSASERQYRYWLNH